MNDTCCPFFFASAGTADDTRNFLIVPKAHQFYARTILQALLQRMPSNTDYVRCDHRRETSTLS
jgi:hypothetical protein